MAKVVVGFGLVLLLANLLTGESLDEWNNLRTTLSAGFDVPEFNDPFAVTRGRSISVPYGVSVESGATPYQSWVGCTDNATQRELCINQRDDAYFEFGDTSLNLFVNWTNVGSVSAATISSVRATVECYTLTNSSDIFEIVFSWSRGTSLATFSPPIGCPRATGFVAVTAIEEYNGTLSGTAFNDVPMAVLSNVVPGVNARIGYIELEVNYIPTGGGACVAPDGAWFPWADEIACAIANFAGVVFRIFQYFINGVIFVVQLIVSLASFVGTIAFGFFVALLASVSVLFNLGAPTPFQEILDIGVVGVLAYIVYSAVSTARGASPV